MYLTHSLRHVSASNYGHNRVELQLYTRMNVSFTIIIQENNYVIIPSIAFYIYIYTYIYTHKQNG